MFEELELKLELSPEDAASLEASPLLPDTMNRAKQRSIYFDTPDQSLEQAGLSLRIRRQGRKRVQTVKAGNARSAGMFVRPEWEIPVKNDTPIIECSSPVHMLIGKAVEDLAPAFVVSVDRHTWDIDEGGAHFAIALDRGLVVAGDRRSSICELELELISGDPVGLFTFARKIDATAPVRLGVLAKAERGYALLGPAATVFKAEPVALSKDMSASQAFRHVAQTCLRQFRLNERLLEDGYRAEPLHQARVALRRLRAAFSIFKALTEGDATCDRLRDDLRWLAGELGEARNLDVLLERIDSGVLYERLVVAHRSALERVAEVLASDRTRALMLDLTEWTVRGPWLRNAHTEAQRQMPARAFAVGQLDHLRRKLKKDGRHLADLADAARHEVRKDAKKLRYASEFFTAFFERKQGRRRYKTFVDILEDLQDQLGHLNDIATASAVLAKLDALDVDGASAVVAPSGRKKLLAAAEDAHDALVDAKRFWR
jgi:triphosphatase